MLEGVWTSCWNNTLVVWNVDQQLKQLGTFKQNLKLPVKIALTLFSSLLRFLFHSFRPYLSPLDSSFSTAVGKVTLHASVMPPTTSSSASRDLGRLPYRLTRPRSISLVVSTRRAKCTSRYARDLRVS
ncbi:hypothetical protein BDN72DRAFT_346678 [Pluteus cervinus]|uniref:Uncharacterized protein n=1 Tax=Pluteus cervinus TaxID=181527 RepID=A0ACD3ABE6_9AGAR|nr:hypothetical protein BDN72DRAFT_346678 [Pluteus cervinus]